LCDEIGDLRGRLLGVGNEPSVQFGCGIWQDAGGGAPPRKRKELPSTEEGRPAEAAVMECDPEILIQLPVSRRSEKGSVADGKDHGKVPLSREKALSASMTSAASRLCALGASTAGSEVSVAAETNAWKPGGRSARRQKKPGAGRVDADVGAHSVAGGSGWAGRAVGGAGLGGAGRSGRVESGGGSRGVAGGSAWAGGSVEVGRARAVLVGRRLQVGRARLGGRLVLRLAEPFPRKAKDGGQRVERRGRRGTNRLKSMKICTLVGQLTPWPRWT
jgi:hypothetical protein